MRSFQRVLGLADRLGQPDLACDALVQIAFLQFQDEDPESAFESLDRADRLAHENQDPFRQLRALAMRADLFMHQKQPAEAAVCYARAVELADSLNDAAPALVYQEHLVEALLQEGKFLEAIAEVNRGLERPKQVGAGGKAALRMYLKLGDIHYETDASVEAHQVYLEALRLAREESDPVTRVQLLGKLSGVQAERGMPNESVSYAQRALEMAESIGDSLLTAGQWVLLGLAHRDREQPVEARASLKKALIIYQSEQASDLIEQVESCLKEL